MIYIFKMSRVKNNFSYINLLYIYSLLKVLFYLQKKNIFFLNKLDKWSIYNVQQYTLKFVFELGSLQWRKAITTLKLKKTLMFVSLFSLNLNTDELHIIINYV